VHPLSRAGHNFTPPVRPHHFQTVNADELDAVAQAEQAL
jgi:hypothetical protein